MLISPSHSHSELPPARASSVAIADHRERASQAPSSYAHQNGSSSVSSRGDGSRQRVDQMALGSDVDQNMWTSSSSNHQASSALPSGAPSGNRINTVSYKTATIKAMIDPELRVSDVVRQLCANAHLGVQEPSALFALRDDEDEELIDDSNMARKIEAGRNFKLCSSPTIEAVEMVDKLASRDDKTLKMATYTLQRLVREKPFYDEFLHRGGLEELVSITLHLMGGNTLAYTLTCIQNLIESSEEKWEVMDDKFIRKVVAILVRQERINVCRPATAILKKLVVSGPDNAPSDQGGKGGDTGTGSASEKSHAHRFGFEVVYAEIQKEPSFLNTLMQRLGSADTTLCLYSLSLINSLLRHVSENLFDVFTTEVERLGVSKAVTRLMDSNRGDALVLSILEYQVNITRIACRRLHTTVTPTDKRHVGALSYLWLQARISEITTVVPGEAGDQVTQKFKWRRLGFDNENVAKDFLKTGWLGLECCEQFVKSDPEQYAKMVLEQINRPTSRSCPWGKASLNVVEILSDHYDIQSKYSSRTSFQPCLLAFSRVHSLGLRFFFRIWSESGAGVGDFGRVSALVRSQVREALRNEASKTWFEIEADFLESDYRTVRDRQMKELELEDDFTSKASIRNLRGRLYRESYEFVRQQRIQCLLEGAWFRTPPNNTISNRTTKTSMTASSNKAWRFYRLSPNRKYLHYCQAAERGPIRSGLDDLQERIDLSLVTDISMQSVPSQHGSNSLELNSFNLTFSLLGSSEISLADFVALNASQFSEWTDGLSMLRSEGGLVNTKETADYIQILTDIGVKVKLLDLTGEAIDVPTSIETPPVPSSTAFFFAEL
ncbi:hypothetical protein CBS101457_004474 [Exobasidium rhododendri]|nr:hypothetical protein CBS101457_004474 [Exobasidium rhododendri]